eukprot:jgi/Ulvmu1/5356/UM022_0150.1
MITYDKSWWGNRVLFRAYGSAFPRALPYAGVAAVIAAALSAVFDTTGWELFTNAYPVQMFFFFVGFMIIFRNNLSYGRYWEGRTQLQQITAHLSDTVRTAINFDRNALPREGATQEQIEQHQWFCDTLVHLVSLFHGIALATLRGDYDMENLVVHDSLAHAPPTNVRLLTKAERSVGDADRTEEHAQNRPAKDGNAAKGGDSSDLGDASETTSPAESSKLSHAWAGSKGVLDYFVLRTDLKRAKHIHRSMKLPIIGGLTQAEGVALGALTTSGDTCEAVPDLDLSIHGVMLSNGTYAPAPTERVQTIASWIHQALIERIEGGGVKASSSLQARVYATLSHGFIAFEHCQKLTDTPFPFPWVQAVNIALLLFTLFAPIAVVGFVSSPIMATALTFMAVATYVTLNEVASDVEDPFHYDPNELPLPQMQYKLNERLLAVRYSERPVAFTDVGGLTGPGNTPEVPGVGGLTGPGNTPEVPGVGGLTGPGNSPEAVRTTPAESAEIGGATACAAATQGPHAWNQSTSAAHAVFADALADSPPSDGGLGRLRFMGRSATMGSARPSMSDMQSFSASSPPSGTVAHKWHKIASLSTKRGASTPSVAGGSPMRSSQSAASAESGLHASPSGRMLPTPPVLHAVLPANPPGSQASAHPSGGEHAPAEQRASDATRAAAMLRAREATGEAKRPRPPAADAAAASLPPSTQQEAPTAPNAAARHTAKAWSAGRVATGAQHTTSDAAADQAPGAGRNGGAVLPASPIGTKDPEVAQHSTQHGLREVVTDFGSPRQDSKTPWQLSRSNPRRLHDA